MIKDDEELVYDLGISKELGEHSQIEDRVLNIYDGIYDWCIQLHPSLKTNNKNFYFKIYNKRDMTSANKVARISMIKPEYIHCSDCSKEEWILSEDEKKYYIQEIQKHWESIKLAYVNIGEYEGFDQSGLNYISNLPMPDYTQL